MTIVIYGGGFGTFNPIFDKLNDIGLKYTTNIKAGVFYDIVDEKLFFLSVIKHGITFKKADVKYVVDLKNLKCST